MRLDCPLLVTLPPQPLRPGLQPGLIPHSLLPVKRRLRLPMDTTTRSSSHSDSTTTIIASTVTIINMHRTTAR